MPRPHKTGFLDSAAVLLTFTLLIAVARPAAAEIDFSGTGAADPTLAAPAASTEVAGATPAKTEAAPAAAQTAPPADPARKQAGAKAKTAAAAKEAAQVKIAESYGKIPLHFEPNQGQTDDRVKFLARGPGYTVFLTPEQAVISLVNRKQAGGETPEQSVVSMKIEGANPEARIEGLEPLPGKSNYFIGTDMSKWRTDVANYAKVRYREVYPGIDVVFYGNPRQMEFDFIVSPGADPEQIGLNLQASGTQGASAFRIENGDLLVETDAGALRFKKPLVYQEIEGARKEIAGEYKLLPSAKGKKPAAAQRVGFTLAAYDAERPLVIDPAVNYISYLGAAGTDIGRSIAVDSSGAVYVTGDTNSAAFPCVPGVTSGQTDCPAANSTTPNLPRKQQTGIDAFITKVNAAGSAMVYSTYLGGSGTDVGRGIAVDGSGNAYITGETNSTPETDTVVGFPCMPAVTSGKADCPATAPGSNPNLPRRLHTGIDAFIAKINSAGSAIVYSTYFGGDNTDIGRGIVVDSSGNAYVTGETSSTPATTAVAGFPCMPAVTAGNIDCPTTQPAVPTLPRRLSTAVDAFVAKINAGGTSIIYSTFLGGTGNADYAYGIAVDGSGNAYVTGQTNSTDFPVQSALYSVNGGGGSDAFVSKINSAGTALTWSTYLGGGGNDVGWGIALDSSSNVYVAGETTTGFPLANAYQATPGGGIDAFVSKIAAAGSSLLYSTYLGGIGADAAYGIAVDGAGHAYVTGETGSAGFPVLLGPLLTKDVGRDAFVSRINTGLAGASSLVLSTFLGRDGDDIGRDIAVDANCNAYVTGDTLSTNLSTIAPSTGFKSYCGANVDAACDTAGVTDAFVAKLSAVEISCAGAPPPPTNPTLTIDGLGTGTGTVTATTPSISCTSTAGTDTGTCSGTVTSGNTVTLTATPASGSTFGGWTGGSGACTGTTSPCTTAAISSNTTIQATFNSPAITVTGAGTGTGTVTATTPSISCTSTAGVTSGTCLAQVTSGNTVTLTATPASGSTFGGWTGTATGTCTGTTSSCTTAAITTSTTVQATFTATTPPGGGPFALTVTAPANGMIISGDSKIFCGRNAGPDCTETYSSGSNVALTAIPEVGYSFASWGSGLGTCSGFATNPCNLSVSAATTVAANMVAAADTGSGARVTTTVNGLPGASNLSVSPGFVNVQYTIRSCPELYVIVNAPALGINWSYINSAGTAIGLPTLSAATPHRSGLADGTYTLYAASAAAGLYDVFLICDTVANGSLNQDQTGLSGVFTYLRATVQ